MYHCSCCGGPLAILGQLGSLIHFRCIGCGMVQSAPAAEVENEIDWEEAYAEGEPALA